MALAEDHHLIQTLPPDAANEPLRTWIRHGRLDRGAEDPDAHRGDSRIEARHVDAIPIVEDESVGMRRREDLPELLEGPRGGRVRGDGDVEQAAAPDLYCGGWI